MCVGCPLSPLFQDKGVRLTLLSASEFQCGDLSSHQLALVVASPSCSLRTAEEEAGEERAQPWPFWRCRGVRWPAAPWLHLGTPVLSFLTFFSCVGFSDFQTLVGQGDPGGKAEHQKGLVVLMGLAWGTCSGPGGLSHLQHAGDTSAGCTAHRWLSYAVLRQC